MAVKENAGVGAVTELSESGEGTQHLDSTAKAPWPQNVLISILGMTAFQANSLVDACPETLGDVSYVLSHVSASQPEHQAMLREFYQEHRTVAELAARHHMNTLAVQRQLVELICRVRDSHLPGILTSGLLGWKQNQESFRQKGYNAQRDTPLWVLEKIGVCEISWLQTVGISTIGNLIDAFSSSEGVPVDGRYLTENTVCGIYEELMLAGVIEHAEETGVMVSCHTTLHTLKHRPEAWWVGVEGPWPQNLWYGIMSGNEIAPPEDLETTLDAALRLLSPQNSMVLRLVYRDGASVEEVGERMGMKGATVYTAKRRALEACREPHVMRLLRCGLQECMRQDEEFRASSINEMRAYPADMLPLQMMTSKTRAAFTDKTVGEIIDLVVAGAHDAGRTAAKQKQLVTLYEMLQSAGVIQRYWAEGANIQNPSHMLLTNKDAQLEQFLSDLWSPVVAGKQTRGHLQVPADISARIHYAMGCALSEDERQKLFEAYPIVTSRTHGKLGKETDDKELVADVAEVQAILGKLREVPSLIPVTETKKERGPADKRPAWPINLLLRIFQCQDEVTLRQYIPTKPQDLEQAIDYILDTRLTETNAKIIRMYFKENMTCRMVGNALNISGAYVGTVIKNSLENILRNYECKRYFCMGYAAAKEEELRAQAEGASESILDESIERLALPQRVMNVLRRGGVKTVQEAVDILDGNGRNTRGLGSNGLLAIYDTMDAAGIVKLCRAKGHNINRPAS